MTFNVRKAGQVAAYFASAEGGSINLLKLMKLIYISERSFLERFDALILDDKFVAMKHGPVCSSTYDCINGSLREMDGWNEFISDRENYMLSSTKGEIQDEDLDELSNAELSILAETWAEHGTKDKWDLVEWTHKNCSEWSDPDGSSMPITYESILRALGKANPEDLGKRVQDEASLKVPA